MADGVVSGPGEGEALRKASVGRVALVKAALPHVTVFEFTMEGPFGGPDPHTHDDHTDCFYILEGEVDFVVNGERKRVGPGTFVAAPPDVLHHFEKREPGTVRFLNIHAPGGFEDELRRLSD